MAYQVLARKWRPRTFDEVIGQQGVTQTLRNAIAGGRIGQSFIFAGPRGVGKTTTARILAKALNCVHGPTPDPCGACDACVEIAEGRDIDVLELDAATHTQVDKVREIIIETLGLRPVRDRYKIFIIDEVHMLSTSSFNALLKSIEEPPPHVVFMMATTELQKIPDTIRSRSQEFEFRTIGTRAIVDQLRMIAEAERIDVEPAALHLIARAAEGSLRDAESAFDQVIAFAGERIAVEEVATVLGLVARDFLLDVAETVADEDAAAVFELAGQAVERGLDFRLVCRELSRLARDMMVVAIDPARAEAPEFSLEGDLDRLKALAARFSREDLLRGFDILARAEFEIRTSPQPRYHFEMALLRWIHARRAVPIADVLDALGRAGAAAPAPRATAPARRPDMGSGLISRTASGIRESGTDRSARNEISPDPISGGVEAAQLKQAVLEEIKRTRERFHGMVVAQAIAIDLEGDTLRFVFSPQQRTLKEKLERDRPEIEALAQRLAGRRITVATAERAAAPPRQEGPPAGTEQKDVLKERVLRNASFQSLLEVMPAEIRDVEEIEE